MENTNSRLNNFDLIRLFAAFQVMFKHTFFHLEIKSQILDFFWYNFFQYFSGVPIFFTVSGFLVYRSFVNSNYSFKTYFLSRFLRIYPALWIATVVTLIVLFLQHSDKVVFLIGQLNFYLWIIGQCTVFQFYTPEILRFWGCHTPNGSLWTIPVEVQFYVILPFIVLAISIFKRVFIKLSFILILLLFAALLNTFASTLNSDLLIVKLFSSTIIPYAYYFILGILVQVYFDKLSYVFTGKFLIWVFVYFAFLGIFGIHYGLEVNSYFMEDAFQLINSILRLFLIFSAAFTRVELSNRILKGNDYSYGIYLYHFVVVNCFIDANYMFELQYFLSSMAITTFIAFISWKFIEKPILALKTKF